MQCDCFMNMFDFLLCLGFVDLGEGIKRKERVCCEDVLEVADS